MTYGWYAMNYNFMKAPFWKNPKEKLILGFH